MTTSVKAAVGLAVQQTLQTVLAKLPTDPAFVERVRQAVAQSRRLTAGKSARVRPRHLRRAAGGGISSAVSSALSGAPAAAW
jgi:hypothetical protein